MTPTTQFTRSRRCRSRGKTCRGKPVSTGGFGTEPRANDQTGLEVRGGVRVRCNDSKSSGFGPHRPHRQLARKPLARLLEQFQFAREMFPMDLPDAGVTEPQFVSLGSSMAFRRTADLAGSWVSQINTHVSRRSFRPSPILPSLRGQWRETIGFARHWLGSDLPYFRPPRGSLPMGYQHGHGFVPAENDHLFTRLHPSDEFRQVAFGLVNRHLRHTPRSLAHCLAKCKPCGRATAFSPWR
jgi:hypothetical protein